MKICYIWVKNFQALENFGISLSSDYQFTYEKTTNENYKKTKCTFT